MQVSILHCPLATHPSSFLGTTSPLDSVQVVPGRLTPHPDNRADVPDLGLSQSAHHSDPFRMGPDPTEALFIILWEVRGSSVALRPENTYGQKLLTPCSLLMNPEGKTEKMGSNQLRAETNISPGLFPNYMLKPVCIGSFITSISYTGISYTVEFLNSCRPVKWKAPLQLLTTIPANLFLLSSVTTEALL